MRVDRPTDRPEDSGESASRPEARPQGSELRDANGLNAAEYIRAWNEKVESGEAEQEQAAAKTADEAAPEKPEPVSEGDDKPESDRPWRTITEGLGEHDE